MRIRVPIAKDSFIIHNETQEDGNPYITYGFETDDIGVDIKLSTLKKIVENDMLREFVIWLDDNAEIHLRAETHKRLEYEQKRDEIREEQRRAERETKKDRRMVHGHVYILKAENGLYKIGKAKNLTQRVTDLGIKIPMSIELVGSFETDDYTAAELSLHEKYKEKRGVGEWFCLNETDIEELMSMCEEHNG